MSDHARFSPSAAHRWMSCPGSIRLEETMMEAADGVGEISSSYADEGTAAHEVASWTLINKDENASVYAGRKATNGVEITYDMCEHVQTYVNQVRQYAEGHDLLVEQRVDFSEAIGVTGSFGTSDAVILCLDEIQVHDLKFGRGVRVDADDNEQLMLYALGALHHFGMLGEFKRVRCVIHQPRLGHLSEWTCTVEELRAFGERAREAAQKVVTLRDEEVLRSLSPSTDACRWCKAKALCPALENKVLGTVLNGFAEMDKLPAQVALASEDLTTSDPEHLGLLGNSLDLIEDWIKAVRARIESELFQGNKVPGWKLVEGKRGNRAWLGKDAAEAAMKKMRLKVEEMYDLSVISPTSAEKLLKKDHPRRWATLEQLITRAEGKPSVAPESDKRPALELKSVEQDFAAMDEVA